MYGLSLAIWLHLYMQCQQEVALKQGCQVQRCVYTSMPKPATTLINLRTIIIYYKDPLHEQTDKDKKGHSDVVSL